MKFLRDPLAHFLVAAALIFAVHSMYTAGVSRRDATITVSRADLERMASLYTAEAGTLPSEDAMSAMIVDHVRDQALSREARRLGLDTDDTIITRRLSQKMAFMVSDLADPDPPSDAVLRDWYNTHPAQFTRPARISFTHVYISPDVRGARTQADAVSMRDALNGPNPPDWQKTGDPFMLQRADADLPFREVARLFGVGFADNLSKIEPGDAWQGPVASSLGLHLVRISSRDPAALTPFDAARADVLADWSENAQREANDAAIAEIISRYKVEIEGAE